MMLEILQFYVSSFWIWLGITWGLSVIIRGLVVVIFAIRGIEVKENTND